VGLSGWVAGLISGFWSGCGISAGLSGFFSLLMGKGFMMAEHILCQGLTFTITLLCDPVQAYPLYYPAIRLLCL